MTNIQLFRERLSKSSIVAGFEFTLLQRNLKEWHERPWRYVGVCLRRVTKMLFLTNEPAKKEEINILTARDTTGPRY